MAREKLNKRHIRKLGKIGSATNYSYYVTLPIENVRDLGWRDNQKLVVRKRGRQLVIQDHQSE
ncbi:MAG: hypothetical protein R3313_01255 [Candidatus Saccharimonadales bacterium]|nr:hypothetical protein [Candidatus Saccharimonadales bacterium]